MQHDQTVRNADDASLDLVSTSHIPPFLSSPFLLSEPPLRSLRGTAPLLHLHFISSGHIHAARRWIVGGVRSHPDELLEPGTQRGDE